MQTGFLISTNMGILNPAFNNLHDLSGTVNLSFLMIVYQKWNKN